MSDNEPPEDRTPLRLPNFVNNPVFIQWVHDNHTIDDSGIVPDDDIYVPPDVDEDDDDDVFSSDDYHDIDDDDDVLAAIYEIRQLLTLYRLYRKWKNQAINFVP
jgi:hypothetical protein